ncbi:MAG: sulfatase-like hydrolase/transferase, partial [Deltaproteobacteria bacterium]|nr:sulfatase-like hydrolase/transferase [Deltaproteobacteria bacterium]
TFGTGKWHNEKSAFEASFQKGKSVFLGGMANHFNVPCNDIGADGKLYPSTKDGFSTDIFADAAIEFITSYPTGKREAPFFCYVAFTAPHDPYSPRHDFIGRYNPDSIPLPGNFLPLHPFAFDDLTVRDENLSPWPRTPEIIREALSDYYGLITHLDERVGDIIQSLKDNGLCSNTIIVFAADNGLAIGSHGLLGKQNLYEHSMKVPLIIAGPGIPEGEISDALVYLFDLFPTLSELCSVSLPVNIDGKSLMPIITGESDHIRKTLFTAYRNTVRAVRSDKWKLIRYPERNYSQLFDLEKDPLELNNLSSDSMYRSNYELLMNELLAWQIAANDTIQLTAPEILPMEYDHTLLVRRPDKWQPEYILKKYFADTMD